MIFQNAQKSVLLKIKLISPCRLTHWLTFFQKARFWSGSKVHLQNRANKSEGKTKAGFVVQKTKRFSSTHTLGALSFVNSRICWWQHRRYWERESELPYFFFFLFSQILDLFSNLFFGLFISLDLFIRFARGKFTK